MKITSEIVGGLRNSSYLYYIRKEIIKTAIMNRKALLNKIKDLSNKYQIVLKWDKIKLQNEDELNNILGMIGRIYKYNN